jgi:rubredoxin
MVSRAKVPAAPKSDYNPHDYPPCPHCGVEQEYPAGDHVARGKSGVASLREHECEVCNFRFTAERLADGSGRVKIEKVGG